MYSLRLSTRRHELEATVTVAGELDIATTPQLRAYVTAVLADDHLAALHLDVSGLTFVGAAGLGSLVGLQRLADRRRIALDLTGPTDDLRRLLKITRLDGYFTLT